MPGPSLRAGVVGEEWELLMVLAMNRAKVSQREIAIAYFGLDRVVKDWDPDGWMRAQVRYKLEKAREIELERERRPLWVPSGEGRA